MIDQISSRFGRVSELCGCALLGDRSIPAAAERRRTEFGVAARARITLVPILCNLSLAHTTSADDHLLFDLAVGSPSLRDVINQFIARGAKSGLCLHDETNIASTRNIGDISAATACVCVGRSHVLGHPTVGTAVTGRAEGN